MCVTLKVQPKCGSEIIFLPLASCHTLLWFHLFVNLFFLNTNYIICWPLIERMLTASIFNAAQRINTLRMGDADLRFYITTVQDGRRKSTFLTRACFSCTIHLIMQYIEPVSEWSCWRMFIETWPHSELNFRHRASSI